MVGAEGSAGSGGREAPPGLLEEGDSGPTRPSGKGCTLALAADLFNEHTRLMRISGSAFAHGKLIFWDQPTESGLGVPGTRDVANTALVSERPPRAPRAEMDLPVKLGLRTPK